MCTIVRPASADPRAAVASDSPGADQVVNGIADDRLVEIPDLHVELPFAVRDRARLPVWQSPQIQIDGPCGSALPLVSTSHSQKRAVLPRTYAW